MKQIHKIKEEINDFHNRDENGDLISKKNHCAVIYGNLPPESKIDQALNFNERKNGIKYLIATDAIGMGINLNISRVIFSNLTKPFGKGKNATISPYQI